MSSSQAIADLEACKLPCRFRACMWLGTWGRMLKEAVLTQVGTIFQPLATYEMPPTYFPTSKVTSCFQTIVDAYGIARYREANPAVCALPLESVLNLSAASAAPSRSCLRARPCSPRLIPLQLQARTGSRVPS